MGLVTPDIICYLFLVTDIKKKWTGKSMSFKTQEYIDMNRSAASAPEDNLIRICEGVIKKSQNAASVVSDVILNFISSGNKEEANCVAHKLISDTLNPNPPDVEKSPYIFMVHIIKVLEQEK